MNKKIENEVKKIVNKALADLVNEKGEKYNSIYEFESMLRNENGIAWGKHKEVDKAIKILQKDIMDLVSNKFMVASDVQGIYDNLVWGAEALISAAAITKKYINNPVDAETTDGEDDKEDDNDSEE